MSDFETGEHFSYVEEPTNPSDPDKRKEIAEKVADMPGQKDKTEKLEPKGLTNKDLAEISLGTTTERDIANKRMQEATAPDADWPPVSFDDSDPFVRQHVGGTEGGRGAEGARVA